MKKLLPSGYFETQERLCEWFEDLKQASGCGENADTGAVLRKVEAMGRKIETYEEQQAAVAKWRGYRFWGDCYNAAVSELPEERAIELIPAYYEVPPGWLRGKGKSWDKAEKQLVKSHKVIRKALAVIEEQAETEGPEWADETREELLQIFQTSSDHLEFERRITDFIYPEEDPATTWVLIAEKAAAELERDEDLPTTAVEQLIAYAGEAGVEMTKQRLGALADSEFRSKQFFYYLLTACFWEQRSVSEEDVEKTTRLVEKGLDYWGRYDPVSNPSGCYRDTSNNDPSRPMTSRIYNSEISVEQLLAASKIIHEAEEDPGRWYSHEDIADAVRAAVKPAETSQALTTAEKK
jgi:hypothetical protein